VRIRNVGAHVTIVEFDDGREVCCSYGVPVAAFVPAESGPSLPLFDKRYAGYVETDARYSSTTTRHMRQYSRRNGRTIPDAEFRALVAPVTGERGDR
jgi:hypothetical protein